MLVLEEVGSDPVIGMVAIDEQKVEQIAVEVGDESIADGRIARGALNQGHVNRAWCQSRHQTAVSYADVDAHEGPQRRLDPTEKQRRAAMLCADLTDAHRVSCRNELGETDHLLRDLGGAAGNQPAHPLEPTRMPGAVDAFTKDGCEGDRNPGSSGRQRWPAEDLVSKLTHVSLRPSSPS